MEALHVSLFLFTLSSLIASFLFSCYRHKPGSANSPPGSHGWPIIGETIPFFRDPGKFVRERMEKYQSHVFQTSLIDLVVQCTNIWYFMAREILNMHDLWEKKIQIDWISNLGASFFTRIQIIMLDIIIKFSNIYYPSTLRISSF